MADQDAQPQDLQIEGFPGASPRWQAVPAAKLNTPPYNRICQVVASNGTQAFGGTGWLHAQGQILTAAHVVAGATSIRVRFGDQANWIDAALGKIADGYFAPNGTQRKCSPQDLALIVPPGGHGVATDGFSQLAGAGLAAAVGFADGVLVQHVGNTADVGPFVVHNCDTDQEHSGCPLFIGSAVHAIHVGLFSGSRIYLSPPQSQTQGYLNSAIRLNTALVVALEGPGE